MTLDPMMSPRGYKDIGQRPEIEAVLRVKAFVSVWLPSQQQDGLPTKT